MHWSIELFKKYNKNLLPFIILMNKVFFFGGENKIFSLNIS